MAKEIVVLTIWEEDIEQYAESCEFEHLRERGLVEETMERACREVWDYMDNTGFFWECVRSAIDETIKRDVDANGEPL